MPIKSQKLKLIQLIDRNDGTRLPKWIEEQQCQINHITIGNIYLCDIIGDYVFIKQCDDGEHRSGLVLHWNCFETLSKVRNDKLNQILDEEE